MKKTKVTDRTVAGIILAVIMIICTAAWGGSKGYQYFFGEKNSVKTAAVEKITGTSLSPDEKAAAIVAKMSDGQKIGQLMMIGLHSGDTALSQDDAYMLNEFHIGNVILFDRNMNSPDQVKGLNNQIKNTVKTQTGVPPFIAVDEEGGKVMRMRSYMPAMPSEQELATEPGSTTRDWAVTTGKALKDMGFNVNLAPVVDLGSAGGRSYSTDPRKVTDYALQACTGYNDVILWCALKHFPGIGKAKMDPHLDGDSVNSTKAELEADDMKPFQELIQNVDNNTMFVLVSNVTFPALEPDTPACLSRQAMTEVLRNQYGYHGLILTDDMEMGAISKHYSFEEIGVKSILAGADIVLVCHEYGHEQAVYNGLLNAYTNGTIPKQVINEKVTRIVKTKLIYGNLDW
jgi:beta-N-acetylhexosaminidase